MATSTIKLPPIAREVAETGTILESYANKLTRLQSAYNSLSTYEKNSSYLLYAGSRVNQRSNDGTYFRMYTYFSTLSNKNEIEMWIYDIIRAKAIDWTSANGTAVDMSDQQTDGNFRLIVAL